MDHFDQDELLNLPLPNNLGECHHQPEAAAAAGSSSSESFQQQLARFQDLLEQSAAEPAAEEAAIGLISAQLMKITFRISALLEQRLEEPGLCEKRIDRLMRLMDGMLRVARQGDRYANLGVKLASMRRSLKQSAGS